jgi:DNA-binding CsgD family transcriptional regulator/PAS domain-containing protein
MIDDDDLSRLIARVYDAALEPTLWDSTLGAISDALGGAGLNIALIDVRKEARFFVGQTRLDEERGNRFLHNPTYIEPIRDKWMAGLTASPVGTLVHREAFWSDSEYRHSAIFNDIIGPQKLWHWAFAPLALEGESLVPFSILRAKGEPLFDQDSAGILGLLLPHMSRAMQLSLRLDTLHVHTQTLEALIEALPIGVILVDTAARVLHHNRAAESILSASEGLTVSHGVLAADRPQQTSALRRLIGAVAALTAGQTRSAGGGLTVSRRSLRRDLLVMVAPLGFGGERLEMPEASAIVLVSDPEQQPRLPAEFLSQRYGLTAQQASLALFLAQGHTLDAAADAMGISRNTARSHLRLLLRKTGTARQPELIRLLLGQMVASAVSEG